jgi:hypothetical protein
VGAKFSAPLQTDPVAHLSSSTMDTRFFFRIKWPEFGVHHPPPSSNEVKEKEKLYIYYTSGIPWLVQG